MMHGMMGGGCHKKCKGAIMLVFGVLFFLGTLGIWSEFTFVKYWPLVLIVVGLHKLLCCPKGGCACPAGECKCKK